MLLFKKSKTNWKHISVVVILFLLVGAGMLLYSERYTSDDGNGLPVGGGKIPVDGKVQPVITDDSGRVIVKEINFPPGLNGVLMKIHIVDSQITLLSGPEIVDGYPNCLPGVYDYLARIVSTSEEIFGECGFGDPRRTMGEKGYKGPTWVEETDFNLILPYFKNAGRIDIFSATDLMLSIDVSTLVN